MSSDPNHQAAHSREDEIAQIVSSRKRKLSELYCVATAAGPDPPKTRPQLDHLQTQALDLFLEQNNLEKSFYFQHATLPSWSYNASDLSHSLQLTNFHSTSSTSYTKTSASAVDANARRVDASNAFQTIDDVATSAERQTEDDLPRRRRDGPKVVPIAQDDPLKPTRDLDKPKSVMRLSGVVVPQTRPNHRPESPRLIIQADGSPNRRPVVKPSRPASPPYSPGTEPTRVSHAGLEDLTARIPLDEPTNVLTPRRDDHDAMQPKISESSVNSTDALQEPVDSATSSSQHQNDSSMLLRKSSLSAQAKSNSQAMQLPAPNETSIPRHSDLGLPAAAGHFSSTDFQKSPVSVPLDLSLTRSGLPYDEQTVNGTVRASADVAFPSQGTELFITKSDSSQPSTVHKTHGPSLSASAMAPELSAGLAQAAPTAESPIRTIQTTVVSPILRRLSPHSPHRVRKRRSRRRGQVSKIVMCRLSDERHHASRHMRLDQENAESKPLSYMKPLFQSQVLSSEVAKGLDQLLKDAPKFVATSDFMSGISEEQDVRILERIRYLQSKERWSLRQPIPSLEPPNASSHWDVVVHHAQWLRTDFREERKLKVRKAKLLAEWCFEWFSSSPSKRASLRIVSKPQKLRVIPTDDHVGYPHELETEPTSSSSVAEKHSEAYDVAELFSMSGLDLSLVEKKIKLTETIMQGMPLYSLESVPEGTATCMAVCEDADAGCGIKVKRKQVPERTEFSKLEEDDSTLPAEDASCALFNPESRPLRSRLNAPWAFKPPTVSMPPQAFYEYRMASQWNWEDDQLLKQYTKDFPSNWPLISDRMAPRSLFNSYVDRRTPWECYERLLATEGPPADAQARQYLRHFPYRLEKARESFDKHQGAIREQAESLARNAGHPIPPLPQKRFPTPLRVDRKPNKRLLAVLDGARKLARKREQNAAKQQNQPQQEGQTQKPAPTRLQPSQTPQYFSKLKHEAEVKEAQRMQAMREQQGALMEAHRRQSGGQVQQSQIRGGAAQPMRPRVGVGQAPVGGQIGAQIANQTRPQPQHPSLPMAMPNGLPANAQSAINARPQANMQAQQRIAPHMNGQGAVSQEGMSARMVQQMQQRAYQQMQSQQQQAQHSVQNQFNHGSPGNGVAIPGMIGAFNNNAMNIPHNHSTHDGLSTPGLQHQGQNGASSRASPHLGQHNSAAAHALARQAVTQPQSLSSGHVPPIVNFHHQIQNSNPNMSPQEVRHHATEQLKHMMSMSRQTAINSATGVHPQAHAALSGAGPQSPYAHAHQQQLQAGATPQMQPPASPYQQASMMRSTSNHSAQGHVVSPANAAAMLATPQQQVQQPHQPQNQYSAQLRQQMYAQQRQHQMSGGAVPVQGSGGSPPAMHVSPSFGVAAAPFGGAGVGRTPTPSGAQMRPPSRSSSQLEGQGGQGQGLGQGQGGQHFGVQAQGQQQRQAPSPRPPSAPGCGS